MSVSGGASPEVPTSAGQPRSRTAVRWLVLVVAVLVVAALAANYVFYAQPPSVAPPPVPPPDETLPPDVPSHVTAFLSNGTALLDVPLMTMYTAPTLQNHAFATNGSFVVSTWASGPATAFTFRWSHVRGTAEAVRFVLAPTVGYTMFTAFRPGPPDGFVALPAGNCTAPCVGARWESGFVSGDRQLVDHEHWQMTYSVRRMAATQEGVNTSWIQVDYALVPLAIYSGDDLPAANVTAPGPSDLLPLPGGSAYNLSKGESASELAEVHGFALPEGPFRNVLPAVAIDAGSAGRLTANLTSEFTWGATEGLWLGWSLTAAHDVSFTAEYFLDMRFGSILVDFVP